MPKAKKIVNKIKSEINKQKALKTYENFYGRSAKSEYEIELKNFKHLAQIGKVNAIEYKAKKHNDKKIMTYRHKFKKMPVLLTNGKDILIVGEFKITVRGIEG